MTSEEVTPESQAREVFDYPAPFCSPLLCQLRNSSLAASLEVQSKLEAQMGRILHLLFGEVDPATETDAVAATEQSPDFLPPWTKEIAIATHRLETAAKAAQESAGLVATRVEKVEATQVLMQDGHQAHEQRLGTAAAELAKLQAVSAEFAK